MVNFTNPGVLGDAAYFRRYYEVSYVLPSNHVLICQFELNLRWLNSIFILFVNLLHIHLSFFHACWRGVCVCVHEIYVQLYYQWHGRLYIDMSFVFQKSLLCCWLIFGITTTIWQFICSVV